MLLDEYLTPLEVSQSAFARRLDVSFQRLNEIVNRKRSVTTETALRLARVLGTSPDLWLSLQQGWDLWHAMHSADAKKIEKLKPIGPSRAGTSRR
jgi:addiction module HigA family antidote